jgi:hypothetical protein
MGYSRRSRTVVPWGKAYQPFGHQSGGIQILDRRKRLPQSQDSIEALPLGALKGRCVLSAVEQHKSPDAGGDRHRETAHVQTISQEKEKEVIFDRVVISLTRGVG